MTETVRILRADELRERGWSAGRIRAAAMSGALVRVRPGVYGDGAQWRTATPEQRVLCRARALALVSKSPPVFAYETAAAAHELPLYRADPARVHVILRPERPGPVAGVIRHRGDVGDDVVVIGGLLCTSLERTSADMARVAGFEQAITVLDAALRKRCVDRIGSYDEERATAFRQIALEIVSRSAYGRARARRALEFADGRAQLPGESISRIRLHEIGFQMVRLQVPIPGPAGSDYFVDFGLDEAQAWGEFDGRMKYADGRLVGERSTAEIFDREKSREDWIRGTTQRRLVRWGWAHISSAQALADRLGAFGIRPPR